MHGQCTTAPQGAPPRPASQLSSRRQPACAWGTPTHVPLQGNYSSPPSSVPAANPRSHDDDRTHRRAFRADDPAGKLNTITRTPIIRTDSDVLKRESPPLNLAMAALARTAFGAWLGVRRCQIGWPPRLAGPRGSVRSHDCVGLGAGRVGRAPVHARPGAPARARRRRLAPSRRDRLHTRWRGAPPDLAAPDLTPRPMQGCLPASWRRGRPSRRPCRSWRWRRRCRR